MTAEVEVLEFLRCLMTTIKRAWWSRPQPFSACEPDAEMFAKAKHKIDGSGRSKWRTTAASRAWI
jgi:hypothetical protein